MTMTVKHVEKDGTEQIHEVLRAWFHPKEIEEREQEKAPHGPHDEVVPFPRDTLYAVPVNGASAAAAILLFSSGDVYVMNANGKTVSQYHLGEWQRPIMFDVSDGRDAAA